MVTRLRTARNASVSVQTEMPSKAMSFIRNPPASDSAGNPPWAASNTPGVVNMKLIVARNSAIASRLPNRDTRGHQGLTASSTAAASSNTPSSAENVYTEKMS